MFIHVIKVLVFITFCSLLKKINSEIFSAIDELEKLSIHEKFIFDEMKLIADEINDDYLNRKLEAWKDERVLVERDITRYITNPLNAFLMIKRATSDIELIRKRFNNQTEEFFDKVREILPTDEDLSGAVEGLIRLQFINKLKSEDFANGKIHGEVTRKPLTPHDLFVIGSEALAFADHLYFAEEYLKLSLQKLDNGLDIDGEVEKNNLLLNLLNLHEKSGDYAEAITIADNLINKNHENLSFREIKNNLTANLDKFGSSKFWKNNPFNENYEKNGKYSNIKENIIYSQVCRGHLKKTNEELSKLHCRYVSSSAFSKLARFKIEEANIEPYIVLFIRSEERRVGKEC